VSPSEWLRVSEWIKCAWFVDWVLMSTHPFNKLRTSGEERPERSCFDLQGRQGGSVQDEGAITSIPLALSVSKRERQCHRSAPRLDR
jgi:hypothetical protein